MKQDLIKDVVQGMLPYLNNAQSEKLQEVLSYALAKYEVTENQNRENNSEQNYIELFLAAKRIEGCSEKSLKYYKATIEMMSATVGKSVKHIETDDIRRYLTEYQEKKKSSKVTIDNIRRILSSFFSWLEDEDYIIKSPNEDTDALFLYYLLKYNKDKIESMGSGTTFKEVSGNTMKNIVVSVPTDKKAQENIASLLGSIDDKIEENERINNNLEQQAQAIFKAWFVDFIPFNGVRPDNWTISSLGEVTNMGAGGDKPKIISAIQTEECPYPIYSNGLSENGLYGYTNTPKIWWYWWKEPVAY